MRLNSSLTITAFRVCCGQSVRCFSLCGAAAAVGSFVTIVLGRPLIALNHNQLDKRASFRAALAGRGRRLQLIFFAGAWRPCDALSELLDHRQ
jgi:ABC-type uncharacterized transport system fused permease/ATPase subunit